MIDCGCRPGPCTDFAGCCQIVKLENTHGRIQTKVSLVQFVMDKQILAILGRPARMRIRNIGIVFTIQPHWIVRVGNIPGVEIQFIEIEQDLAVAACVCALSILTCVSNDHRCSVVHIVVASQARFGGKRWRLRNRQSVGAVRARI